MKSLFAILALALGCFALSACTCPSQCNGSYPKNNCAQICKYNPCNCNPCNCTTKCTCGEKCPAPAACAKVKAPCAQGQNCPAK